MYVAMALLGVLCGLSIGVSALSMWLQLARPPVMPPEPSDQKPGVTYLDDEDREEMLRKLREDR